ncbi:MAG TPA: UDP-N-acetylglucosamine--N-acetylmuramyl-(pentapeptide) pyrophosphoryl-undecaprenol N-acetylglucosamine transferase [Propionibacteriaceae bacterium]|nr:UDP-N-acetylglucosamine--N-acetylmuramyl-(pentapeptide) pyrophosphoryl-undecaprenol N-acetylglucosamine transferase [Propionibacteriaceae bacterium]
MRTSDEGPAAEREVSIVLAGGGSAGHTSPLIATALELRRLRPDARLTAVGTARGLETRVVPAAGLPLELIPPVPVPRRPSMDLALVGPRLWRAIAAAVAVLRRAEADAVLGFGGYVSAPVYLAARRVGVPILLHEQNALPGLANRLAAHLTHHVYTSFPNTPLPHATYIGLPLRHSITDLDRAKARTAGREQFQLQPDLPVLLVSGGSQGAASINTALLGARDALLAAGIQVLHVLGPRNLTDQTLATSDTTTGARYSPVAYVDKMEQAYAAADLMLGRCGASTVLETAAVGLPAIFVPYPHGNGEQARNARAIVEAGGGILLPDDMCTQDWVAQHVPALIGDGARLAGMSGTLRGVAKVDAAGVLAEQALEVAS